ncbi:mechanosensitive ion channel family protein [Haliangium ochraceum]|uniref:MscS Mechanosensitive ion channel n=1 Tax=Haliangium ochraceum (strain DSM 14365 / JCM 11303 / SMP-2) TaxID=502025 RepID=D0LSH1_HALO1|nr:mechanosensitive ion channel family protein [Haliangium ochraceum]ACY15670.1 MscS Mechanosensitive ion channel [Haliangium ochraceum DSM 14365]
MELSISDLVEQLTGKLETWITGFVEMLPNLVVALIVVLFAAMVAKWAQRMFERLFHKISGNKPISDLLAAIVRVGINLIGLFVALGLLQLDKTVTSLLAGVGVVGLALGFAFQDIAANFMSGIIMAVKQPFSVGDLLELNGRLGKVKRIDLRATEMQTLDGLSVLVPNKDIFQNTIVNYTRTTSRRMDLEVGTAYCDDLEHVREISIAAVQELEHRDSSRDIELFFGSFGDSSINFTLRVWLDKSDQLSYLSAKSEAMIALKKAFDQNDITIPFPIRTLDFGAKVVGGERLDAMRLPGSAPESDERERPSA